MRHPLTLFPILFFFLFSFSAISQELLEKAITVDGQEREYLLYVPAAYDGGEDWPLVLNLHGYLWDGASQVWISGMNPVADTAHFLIAYPTGQMIDLSGIQGVPPFIPPQGVGWNLGGNITEYDDITFLGQMIDEIVSEYAVNESRIYSTGFSMGGITSYMLACALSGRIAAVAPVSASLLPEEGPLGFSCSPPLPVPVLQIHGTNDIVDPFEDPWGTQGALNSINYWVGHNGCSPDPLETVFEDTDVTDESTVTAIRYNDCNDGTEVWLYRIDGGGHWWPGGSDLPAGFEALGPVNRDINASVEIWNFFNRQTLTSTEAYLKPSEINLRAYPNPASTQLTFEFELPEAAPVNITLYNPLGQPVQELTDENLPAGRQRIKWQRPASLPAGLYYYRLQIGERFVARPVVLE
ncbi:MAG: T9SS type A sorting domain-containing protein [Lewinellaceae bacterium]|nr:T9SS type A sorting domain-containing protein [Lewinellaceae bacterium]